MIIGETFIKIFKNDSSVYDYGSATGVISWHPIKQINIQCGNDKLFIGNGYRSLFLSDFASQYPYLKTTYTSKRIQYSYILTSFQNPGFYLINAPTDNKLQSYQTKTGSFAFASINLTSSLQVGLFESMIWENNDARSNKFNYGVLNPIIFTKSAYYGLNNTNNALIGLNLNYKLLNQTALYGQFIIDNLAFSVPDGRRIGYQMGFKSHDVFAIKNLYIQSEINSVNPYTYSSSSNEQSYTHNLMPLAHPLGANFYELVGIISYRYKNIYAKFKYNYSQVGLDTSLIQNEGQDLLKTVNTLTSNSRLLEGEKTTIQNIDISLQYIINPKTNFQLFIEYANRSLENQSTKENTSYLFFGLRTQLTNHYSDF